jgi:hypothetical protein
VREAKQAREQSHRDRLEAIEQQEAAEKAFAAAHREEMSERDRAYDAELRLQRIVQADRISEAIVNLIETAYDEVKSPPPMLTMTTPVSTHSARDFARASLFSTHSGDPISMKRTLSGPVEAIPFVSSARRSALYRRLRISSATMSVLRLREGDVRRTLGNTPG